MGFQQGKRQSLSNSEADAPGVVARAPQIPYRTPRSAIAFAALLLALLVVYVVIAFAYGHGFVDLLWGLLAIALFFLLFALLFLLASWWTGSGPFAFRRNH